MNGSGDTIVFRQTILKRVFALIASALLIIVGSGATLLFISEGAPGYAQLITVVITIFFIYVFFSGLTKSRTVLVARPEGFIPVMVTGKNIDPFPWSGMIKFDKVTARIRGNNILYIGFYLKEGYELGGGIYNFMNDIGKGSLMGDGGEADFYMPANMFSEKVDEVISILESMRIKYS